MPGLLCKSEADGQNTHCHDGGGGGGWGEEG